MYSIGSIFNDHIENNRKNKSTLSYSTLYLLEIKSQPCNCYKYSRGQHKEEHLKLEENMQKSREVPSKVVSGT